MKGPRVYPLKRMRAIESYENARVEYILKRGDARTYRLHEQHGRAKVRVPALRAFLAVTTRSGYDLHADAGKRSGRGCGRLQTRQIDAQEYLELR